MRVIISVVFKHIKRQAACRKGCRGWLGLGSILLPGTLGSA